MIIQVHLLKKFLSRFSKIILGQKFKKVIVRKFEQKSPTASLSNISLPAWE